MSRRIDHQLQDAATGAADRCGDPDELVDTSVVGRRQLTIHALVIERARGREAQRPRPDRVGGQRRHLRHLAGRRRAAGHGSLPQHVDAQRRMRHLGADVEVELPAGQDVEIFLVGLPGPRQPLVQRRARDVFDAFHQVDQPLMVCWDHRCEADAAVAGHH